VPAHLIEYWPMRGEKATMWAPACLTCGWHGGDGTRSEAEAEARMHERGERHPWQRSPETVKPWKPGDPTRWAA
jgi:hypothetical protein